MLKKAVAVAACLVVIGGAIAFAQPKEPQRFRIDSYGSVTIWTAPNGCQWLLYQGQSSGSLQPYTKRDGAQECE